MKFIPYLFIFFAVFSACSQKNEPVKVQLTDTIWKQKLSPEAYYVLREKGTEKPYSGKFLFHKENGYYTCAGCGNRLFESNAKFDSHCGWPSFDEQISASSIRTQTDRSLGMVRTEITCANCGGHLGHLFDDGPTETGKRYCVNSLSLQFEPMNESHLDTLILGGGCFWCIESVFDEVKGVKEATSGYTGGVADQVTYEEVCSGKTKFIEVVSVVYDSTQISTLELLKIFFTIHDPTTLNRQGADVGYQYKSAIFYKNDAQKKLAVACIQKLAKDQVFDQPIVTELFPFDHLVPAEEYHQDYFKKNPNNAYCKAVIQPKRDKFEKSFKELKK